MSEIRACRAFIVRGGTVLLIRESKAYAGGTNIGKYDCPGGKLENGEDFRDALLRETLEECGLHISVGEPFYTAEWRPVIKGKQMKIRGTFFACTPASDAVALSSAHDDFRWIDPRDYKNYELTPAVRGAFQEYCRIRYP